MAMIDLADIRPLSDFQRNAKGHIRRLKRSGKPSVLTVNGQAEVVIQSARAYQELIEDRELLESLRSISRGLEQAKRGEGRPMREFLEELAREHGIPLNKDTTLSLRPRRKPESAGAFFRGAAHSHGSVST